MPENKTASSSPSGDDQTKKDNATSHALVPFGAPKEAVEICHEDKMTNTEVVNEGIYFGYPSRRHSCSLVNIPSPCVNKMISHIEDVESKIEGHLKQFETSLEERRRAAPEDLEKGRRVAKPSREVKPKEERDEKCPELKQEMETLLSEAIFLIKSLETDRAEAEEALKRQQSRKKKINKKIDYWSIWRLQEMPMAVQREHETYLRDILELRWHIENKSYKIKLLEEQKAAWEEANGKVQADIDYMNEHSALLNSKLMQEIQNLRKYSKKKSQVMELYRQVHGELQDAIEDCEKLKIKIIQNREEMERDIENDVKNMEAYKSQMDQLTVIFDQYKSLIQNVNKSIEKNEEAMNVALQETRTSSDELSALTKMLEDLKRIYEQLLWRKKHYESEYEEVLQSFRASKKAWDDELADVAKDFSDLLVVYNKLMEENKKLEMDIEITSDAIHESVRKKSEFESDIRGLMIMKLKNEEYLRGLYKDAYQIGAVFHLTRYKTEELEEKISEVRRKFQGREDFLKKITRSEVANGTILQKKLFSLQEEEQLEREELLRRIAIYSLTLAEIEEPLLQMEENAEQIKALHKEHFSRLGDIVAKREDVKINVERTKEKLQIKGKKTQEALIKTEAEHSVIFGEIEAAKNKTAFYQDKITTLNKELEEREKARIILNELLDILREKHASVKFTKKHIQAIYDHLIHEKVACEERFDEEEQIHRNLIAVRQKTLADLKKLQDDSLVENLRLAQEYQRLQMNFLAEKDNYFYQYDRQLSLNASIRDKRELCQLQRQIHKRWQKYLRLVVLYSRVRLAQFQAESQESIQKILVVQEESSNLMQHIVEFFQDLSQGPCENDD
ncbi:coiled-coil domain-containing protein 178 [Myotis daubentonii]|uniref:coiled-coil domain-containing protein 178 n=1 Tax=Myotis daubentonii TaxID=98922 RepID=UPI0028739306|nr:coiled-coil domain-containing protein 178 [Myotis daubentonii]